MRKLTAATLKSNNVFLDCVSSIKISPENIVLIDKLTRESQSVLSEWDNFDTCAARYDLARLPSCSHGYPDQDIISGITKKELTDLYSKYMVSGNDAVREIYNVIKASAPNGRCPFCGIGFVETLDHYLPKARYPVFSVNPKNLIPSCFSCNKGKNSAVIDSADCQPLYPYLSPSIFYEQDWIKAVVIKTKPLAFDFILNLPQGWSAVNKNRAKSHFDGFNLAEKYTLNATQLLSAIESLIHQYLDYNTPTQDIMRNLQSVSQKEPPNTTYRLMLIAVSKEADICRGDYLQ